MFTILVYRMLMLMFEIGNEKFDLRMVLQKSQGSTKFITIHPEENKFLFFIFIP